MKEPHPSEYDTPEEYEEAQSAYDAYADQVYEEWREERRGVHNDNEDTSTI